MTHEEFVTVLLDSIACRMTVGTQILRTSIVADPDLNPDERAEAMLSEEQFLQKCDQAAGRLNAIVSALEAVWDDVEWSEIDEISRGVHDMRVHEAPGPRMVS